MKNSPDNIPGRFNPFWAGVGIVSVILPQLMGSGSPEHSPLITYMLRGTVISLFALAGEMSWQHYKTGGDQWKLIELWTDKTILRDKLYSWFLGVTGEVLGLVTQNRLAEFGPLISSIGHFVLTAGIMLGASLYRGDGKKDKRK